MERLTTRDSDGTAITYEVDDICYYAVPVNREIEFAGITMSRMDNLLKSIRGKVIDRLAQYEDTGLTPEQIHELLHDTSGPLHKKLGEWIDAERDGRMIILPCEIGHPIFILRGDVEDGYETRKKTNIQVVGFTLGCLNKKFELYPFYFLTREEAEAALKGRNDG